MASKEIERKRQVNAALRAVRRVYRKADTAGEILERNLDRMILRKTRPAADELEPLINQYRAFRSGVTALEVALTDLLRIATY